MIKNMHVFVNQASEEIDEAWVAEQLIILEHQSQEQHITDCFPTRRRN